MKRQSNLLITKWLSGQCRLKPRPMETSKLSVFHQSMTKALPTHFVSGSRLCQVLGDTLVLKLFFSRMWGKSSGSKSSAAAVAKSLQSCPTLCNPIEDSPPGSPVPGILQARTLEWVAISFSNAWKWKVKRKSSSRVQLFTTPWTAAYQAPLSMGFSRQEYWSGVPSPSPFFLLYHTVIYQIHSSVFLERDLLEPSKLLVQYGLKAL